LLSLKDFLTEIYKGEFVGIIGKNGSGKSTLLKMIAGIFEPDKGSTLKVDGNLVPFLELGVGFNHELSGRENIYLNGTILGMTKKYIDEKFDEIVKLSELDNFINEPVKNYSSGMQVRLAFSIAVQADADIFILDEVLSVGDERFQAKSVGKVKELVAAGKTVLFVSHEIEEIKEFCNRVMFIDEGKISYFGDTEEAVRIYHEKYQITDKK
jgi:ABC-2 type transport system ATP-binding protein